MSSAGRCIARSTSSGMVVGPGIARNSRPARTVIFLFLMGWCALGKGCRGMTGNSSQNMVMTAGNLTLFPQAIGDPLPDLILDLGRGRAGDDVGGTCPFLACAVQRRRFPVGASPTRQSLQPEAIGAVMEVTKWLKPSISVSRIGDSASVQAATRVNAEQASKRSMCRPTRLPYRGRLIRLDEMSEAIRPDAVPG